MKKIKKIMLVILMTFVVMPSLVLADAPDVKIGNMDYETLQEAIDAAANGDEIILLTNISQDILIKEGQKISINLNKFNIESDIENNGDLTIKGPGNILSLANECEATWCGYVAKNNGVLLLENLSINIRDEVNLDPLKNNGYLELNSVNSVVASEFVHLINNAENSQVVIEDGIFDINKEVSGGLINNKGITLINSGTYKGHLGRNKGQYIINDGNFKTEGNVLLNNCSNGIINLNDGIYEADTIAQNFCFGNGSDNAKINVNNGSYTAKNLLFVVAGLDGKNTKLTINDGNFVSTTKEYVFVMHGDNKSSIEILGGVIKAENSKGFDVNIGNKVIIGTNDKTVSSDNPIIYINKGTLKGNDSIYEFYDGKIILESKIDSKVEIPKDYYIKYDDNKNGTYTAYLSNNNGNENNVTTTTKKVENTTNNKVVNTTQKKEQNPKTADINVIYILAAILVFGAIGVIGNKKAKNN